MITAKDIINEISLLGTSVSVAASMNRTPQITPNTEKVYSPDGTPLEIKAEKLTGYLSNRGKFFSNQEYGRFTEPDMPNASGVDQQVNFIKHNSLINSVDIIKKVL